MTFLVNKAGFRCILIWTICINPISLKAQNSPWQREWLTVFCFNMVDEQGKTMNIDGENDMGISDEYGYDQLYFNENIRIVPDIKPGAKARLFDTIYRGQPQKPLAPFTRRYVYIFSRKITDEEIVITSHNEIRDRSDTMRIIFLNYEHCSDEGKPVLLVVDDIPFVNGTYVLNCEKNLIRKEKIKFMDAVPLQTYFIGNSFSKKGLVTVPGTILDDYNLPGLTFHKDGSFDLEILAMDYPYYGKHGYGRYKLTPTSLTLYYDNVIVKRYRPKIKNDTITVNNYVIAGRVLDETGAPVPFAVVTLADNNTGTITDKQGALKLKVPKGQRFRVTVKSIKYETQERYFPANTHYPLGFVLVRNNDTYVDSGTVEKAIFTDYNKNYIGMYWLENVAEDFSLINQEQMSRRKKYLGKGFSFPPPKHRAQSYPSSAF